MTVDAAPLAPRDIPPLGQIVYGPITFVAHCDHQGIPFFGSAFVGYVPYGAPVAQPTLRRMVQSAARHGEASIERRLAETLEIWARPLGIAVVVRTSHECTGPRLLVADGDRQISLWRGRYRSDRALRSEFLARCRSVAA